MGGLRQWKWDRLWALRSDWTKLEFVKYLVRGIQRFTKFERHLTSAFNVDGVSAYRVASNLNNSSNDTRISTIRETADYELTPAHRYLKIPHDSPDAIIVAVSPLYSPGTPSTAKIWRIADMVDLCSGIAPGAIAATELDICYDGRKDSAPCILVLTKSSGCSSAHAPTAAVNDAAAADLCLCPSLKGSFFPLSISSPFGPSRPGMLHCEPVYEYECSNCCISDPISNETSWARRCRSWICLGAD